MSDATDLVSKSTLIVVAFWWKEREVGRTKSWTSSGWFLCVFVGDRRMGSGGSQMVRGGPLGQCGRTARPLSGRGYNNRTVCGLSSQKRVYPAEMWPSSGRRRRWPISWRPGGVATTEIEKYLILFTKALDVPDFVHLYNKRMPHSSF